MGRKQAGERLGFNLTPAEASGSPLAARQQAGVGYTTEGARRMEAQQNVRAGQENKAINSLLDEISTDSGIASRDVRKAAKASISEKEKALQEKSKPLYEDALFLKGDEKQLVDPRMPSAQENGKILRNISPESMGELKRDPIIAGAIDKIGNDPIWKKDLNGVPPYTVKYLDYVKKYIDDLNSSAIQKGQKNKSRLLSASKNDLVTAIDAQVPQYKEARAIYGEGAQPIKDLKESVVGNIAKIKDKDLKRISQRIFDPTQTDIGVLKGARDEIMAQDPVAWRRMMRNEMERRMAKVDNNSGSNFYKKVLQNENDFNHFKEAAKGLPKVQEKLDDMRNVLPMIFNKPTTKAAKGNSENHMNMLRNAFDAAIGMAKKHLVKRYDQAAIDLITQGKWDKEFDKIHKIKNEATRNDKIAGLFEKVLGGAIPIANKEINY